MQSIENKINTILTRLAVGNLNDAQLQLQQMNYADQARVIAQLPLHQQVLLLPQLNHASQVFEFLSLAEQMNLANELGVSQLVPLLDGMHSDDFIDLFNQFAPSLQQQLRAQLSAQSQNEIRSLAAYPEGCAGAMMSSNYLSLDANMTIDQAIAHVRQVAADQDTLYVIYIVDAAQTLIGVMSLREMLLAAPQVKISEVMHRDVVVGYPYDDQELIAKTLAYYDFIALPIVDTNGSMLGIVTYDDAMDIARDEATEDFLKAGAVDGSSKLSIKTAPILQLYQKRVFWLVILVFGSLLSGIGIAHFEDIIAANIVLVFFLPLLVGSGGNAGSQSATLMVRALATGDVELKDWLSLLGRESLVALCLGATMAFAVSILGFFRGDAMIALVLAISMLGIVLLGCLIGMSLPFILNKLKLDPASASAPLVTSICDATGVIVYLFIASKILGL